jgi:hydroxymethylpyrimidine kinase/phosphomethylpyrimidine kinase/thiamine-phosphate diphosphorylase
VNKKNPVVWTIAGSDSGGGAGIQADLPTFRDFGCHGCSVVTGLTAQNSFALGDVAITSRKNLAAQINALDSDLPAAAIKIGMLGNARVATTVAKYLRDYRLQNRKKNTNGFVVLDTVLFTTTGGSLFEGENLDELKSALFSLADVITPNRDEVEMLLGRKLADWQDIPQAAEDLLALGANSVLITGGHFSAWNGLRFDYWTNGTESFWLGGENIETQNTHGTGCTLASAIAAALARGFALQDALVLAKAYVTAGLRQAQQFGSGPGPVAHTGWPDQIADLPRLYKQHPALQSPLPTFASCDGELGFYPVVDSVEWLEKLLPLGVKTIQFRNKILRGDQLSRAVKRCAELAQEFAARVFVNDHWQLAIKHRAYGVHLGQEDLEMADIAAIAQAGLRLGISTHSYTEIARTHAIQPSYIAIGPIFPTATKKMLFDPQGLIKLTQWVQLLKPSYPLTAIGGIDLQNVDAVLATGVGSTAMVRAVTEAADYPKVVAAMLSRH